MKSKELNIINDNNIISKFHSTENSYSKQETPNGETKKTLA